MIRRHQLNEIEKEVSQGAAELVRTRVIYIPLAEFRRTSPDQFITVISKELHARFDRRVNELMLGGIQGVELRFLSDNKQKIARGVKTQVEKAYVDKWFSEIVKPAVTQGIDYARTQVQMRVRAYNQQRFPIMVSLSLRLKSRRMRALG
jgi:hypothetical protein